jgi:hypothetical protein
MNKRGRGECTNHLLSGLVCRSAGEAYIYTKPFGQYAFCAQVVKPFKTQAKLTEAPSSSARVWQLDLLFNLNAS